MKHSPVLEAERCLASQEIPRYLWDPNVHHHIHKSPPNVPTLSHNNPGLATSHVFVHSWRHTERAVQARGSVKRFVVS